MTKQINNQADSHADNNEGAISRWSKRKLALKKGATAPLADTPPQTADMDLQGPLESEEAIQERLETNRQAAEAIDLETLNADSDMSVFFREGVPDSLRKMAFATLWRSDPVYSCLDGLVEYGQNFGDPALNMKEFISSYKIGKGFWQDFVAPEQIQAQASEETGEEQQGEPIGSEAVQGADPAQDISDLPAESQPIEAASTSDAGEIQETGEADERIRIPLRQRLDFDHYDV